MHKPALFLKCHPRVKDGKEHRYWSICENRRTHDGRRFQRQVIYLGEINDTQKANWTKQVQVFDAEANGYATLALFPEDRLPTVAAGAVQIRLSECQVGRPRQWGACWLGLGLWKTLNLDEFWSERLKPSREGTQWRLILSALSVYRLVAPGSEWHLHRQWFDTSALSDLLGPDFQLGCKENLYRTLDKLLKHKEALFTHLRSQWEGLFAAKFDVLLYDLTSTYFESDPPFPEGDKRRFGYSRDKRSDCVQVVIALVLTTEGLPIGYEVFAGNTSDKATLEEVRRKIEDQYGKLQRTWIMDRRSVEAIGSTAVFQEEIHSQGEKPYKEAELESSNAVVLKLRKLCLFRRLTVTGWPPSDRPVVTRPMMPTHPTAQIQAMHAVVFVMKDGVIFKRP